jgi:hypothetical protein
MKVLSGLDLNGNQITNVDTIIDGTENDIVKIGSNGELVDSGVSVSDIEPNVIESVSVNGTALTPTNKNVDIDLSDYVETTDERIIPTVTMNLSYDFDMSEGVSGNHISNTSYSFPNDEVPNVQFAKLTLNMTCNVKLNGSVVMTSETTQNGWFNKHDILNTVSGEEETMNVIHITAPFFYGEAVVECEAIIAYQTLIIFEPNYWVNDAVQAGLADFAEQLPPVAKSNDYDDLDNKPDLSGYAETANLSAVATSGDYDDLSNKPDLSGYAETANLATVATSGDYDDLLNRPDLASVATSGDYGDLSNTPDLSEFISQTDIYGLGIAFLSGLASVATSGSYDDLSDTPNLSEFISETDIYGMGIAFLSNLASVATSGDYGDLSNTPDLSEYVMSSDLASVATSGDYEDLSNTPELATVATSGNYEDLSDTPDLSDFVLSENLAAVATSGSYNDLEDRPNLTGFGAFFSLNILNEDSTDSFTFDATYISSDAIPIVQIVYENKIVTDGIEVSFDPSTGSITVQWDDTKYDVNSNTPLTVSVVGAPTEREDS